MVRIIENYTLY
jgi:serine/threonine-protein kinase ULK2